MEKTAAKQLKKGQKVRDFREMFFKKRVIFCRTKEKFRRHFGLKFYRELYRYEYVRIPRKRERKTGVF